jgi:hypothetical protein
MLSKQEIEDHTEKLLGQNSATSYYKGFIAGANYVNERQPYTAGDMQSFLNWTAENGFHRCTNDDEFWWEKSWDDSNYGYGTDELIKLWEESKNG